MRNLCLISFLAVILSLFHTEVFSEEIALGFPESSTERNILTSEDPFFLFARRAVTGRLLSLSNTSGDNKEKGSIALELADSIQVSEDGRRWSLRLKSGALFSDGSAITGADLEYSIKRCIKSSHKIESRKVHEDEASEYWIDFISQTHLNGRRVEEQTFLTDLSRCPILQRSSSVIFGRYLGDGTNLVSSGQYIVSSFKTAKELELKRVRSDNLSLEGVEKLTLRSFSEAKQGLTALRLGSISLFFTKSEEVLAQASNDETLLMSSCYGYKVLYRRGLKFKCDTEIDLVNLRFIS